MTVDFAAAAQTVQAHLDLMYAGEPEQPAALPYGFDTGKTWAPMVDWDGVMGVYIWLVDKTSGALTPKSFPEFLDMPDPRRVGRWPKESKI